MSDFWTEAAESLNNVSGVIQNAGDTLQSVNQTVQSLRTSVTAPVVPTTPKQSNLFDDIKAFINQTSDRVGAAAGSSAAREYLPLVAVVGLIAVVLYMSRK